MPDGITVIPSTDAPPSVSAPSPFSDFLRLMTDTVMIEPKTGQSAALRPSYGAGVVYRCRVDYSTKEIRTAEGETVTSAAHLWIMGAPAISTEDRLTLASGRGYPILDVVQEYDDRGPHHAVVYLG